MYICNVREYVAVDAAVAVTCAFVIAVFAWISPFCLNTEESKYKRTGFYFDVCFILMRMLASYVSVRSSSLLSERAYKFSFR